MSDNQISQAPQVPQPAPDQGSPVPDQSAQAPDQGQGQASPAPQPDTSGADAGTADLESRVPGASGTADLENRVAPNVAARAAQAAQNTKTGMFKSILIGALQGLANHGIPGAIEGAISPDTAKTQFSQRQQLAQGTVDKQKADIALAIADAHRSQAMAENYPAELREQTIQRNQTMAMGLKAYGVNPLGVVQDPQGAEAMAHQLMNEGKMPMVMEVADGQYAVYDWNQYAGSPMGLQDANLYAAFNGGQQLTPDQWANPKFASLRTAVSKQAQQFLHPAPANLMAADQMISKYQGIVSGIDKGLYQNIPDGAKQRVIQTLAEMVEAHNQYLSEMTKMRQAPANARYFQVNLSDGTVTAMTGPQLQAQSNQAQGNNPGALKATPVNSKANDLLQATDSNGREVAGTPSELNSLGINPTGATKMAANEAFAVRAARQLIQNGGLFQKIAQEMKALGPENINLLNSRINEFLLGKVGTGPQYVPLRNDLNLLTTRLQQVHVGNRPSDKLFEHFKSMWDAGKMDYATLNSALSAGHGYAVDRAMLPSRPKAKATPQGQ